jgi:hypothetical protein
MEKPTFKFINVDILDMFEATELLTRLHSQKLLPSEIGVRKGIAIRLYYNSEWFIHKTTTGYVIRRLEGSK